MLFHNSVRHAGGMRASHDGPGGQESRFTSGAEPSGNEIPAADLGGDTGVTGSRNLERLERCKRLESLISSHLAQWNLESAIFIAELLYAECADMDDRCSEKLASHYLYSLALFLNGDILTSLHISAGKRHDSVGCAYVYSRCCLKLRKNYSEALDAILSLQYIWGDNSGSLFGYPEKSTLYLLAGKLFKVLDHETKSETFLKLALDENPYLWEASKELCALRSPTAKSMFKNSKSTSNLQHNSMDYRSKTKLQTPFKAPSRHKQNLSNSQTNSLLSASNTGGVSMSPHFFRKSKFTTTPTTATTNTIASSSNISSITAAAHAPMDSKHITTTTPSKLSGTDSFSKLLKSPTERKPVTTGATNLTRISSTSNVDQNLEELFSQFVKIEYCRSRFDSFKAIRLIQQGIPQHLARSMPWCLSTLGKLHFELANYQMSESYFLKLRTLQPTRFEDMDLFSTVLWHLQDKTTLSSLCAELLSIDKYNPIAWCTFGNLHSLNKDHDEAISAFGKAIQLDPFFTYAYTLQGHEYSNTDAFDNAKTSFRHALTIDKSHYNALYGLGMCCVKLGKFEEALLYFEKAREINPVNVILNCCCGVALERLQQPEKALNFYELANELQPNSSLALFKKSQLLLNMGQYSSALVNFQKLETLTPDEAHVHFLLGNLYQIVGKKQDAMNQYTIAMNLDPKGSQLIKEAMEKCHEQG